MSDGEHDEDSGRLYTPCPVVTCRFKGEELVVACPTTCGRFHARCCMHLKDVCHYEHVVYTDGVCINNGRSGAVAGIGIAFGPDAEDPDGEDTQFSIPVDDKFDPEGNRTSQRAELLAAIQGLEEFCGRPSEGFKGKPHNIRKRKREHGPSAIVVITTDSEYVVKGMTEWLPNWRRNGLRKSNGQRPSNLDLFLKLDASVEEHERRHSIRVKFWHIDRAYNTIADRLAKRAARAAATRVDEDSMQVERLGSAWSF